MKAKKTENLRKALKKILSMDEETLLKVACNPNNEYFFTAAYKISKQIKNK